MEQITIYRDKKGRAVFYSRLLGPLEAAFMLLVNKIAAKFGKAKKNVVETEEGGHDTGKLRCKDV